MTDLSGYAKKSTANGDTRSDLRLRLRRPEPRSTCGHHTGTTTRNPSCGPRPSTTSSPRSSEDGPPSIASLNPRHTTRLVSNGCPLTSGKHSTHPESSTTGWRRRGAGQAVQTRYASVQPNGRRPRMAGASTSSGDRQLRTHGTAFDWGENPVTRYMVEAWLGRGMSSPLIVIAAHRPDAGSTGGGVESVDRVEIEDDSDPLNASSQVAVRSGLASATRRQKMIGRGHSPTGQPGGQPTPRE